MRVYLTARFSAPVEIGKLPTADPLPGATHEQCDVRDPEAVDPPDPEVRIDHGVLAVEMEASALYTLAASYQRKALAICTVSDHVVTGEHTSSHDRERTFGAMVEIALEAALGGPGPVQT